MSTNDFTSQEVYIYSRKDLREFINNYEGTPDMIPKFKALQKYYPVYRAVKGDGNCFYRALAFLYLRQANLNHFRNVFHDIKNVCTGHRMYFEDVTYEEKLREIYNTKLSPIANSQGIQRQKYLQDIFNSSWVFDTMMILYFRNLNYHYIVENSRIFSHWVNDPSKIEGIRQYGRDSEGIQYKGISSALNIKLTIHICDQGQNRKESYNQNLNTAEYDFFLRHEHFDILYHKNSPYLKEVERSNARITRKDQQPTPNYRMFKQPQLQRHSYERSPMRPSTKTTFEQSFPEKRQISHDTKQTKNNFLPKIQQFIPQFLKQTQPQLNSQLPSLFDIPKKQKYDPQYNKVQKPEQFNAWKELQTTSDKEEWKHFKEYTYIVTFFIVLLFLAFKL